MSHENGGVKNLPERGALIRGTHREPFQEPIAEEPEEGITQNALLCPNLPQASPPSPRKGEISQRKKKKFVVERAEENQINDDHQKSNNIPRNDGNNNRDDREGSLKSRFGFGSPGPGSGETKGGTSHGKEPSGRGSSLSQELVFYFQPKNKGPKSDEDSSCFPSDNL